MFFFSFPCTCPGSFFSTQSYYFHSPFRSVGSIRDEEPPHHPERAAGSQRLRLQPDQTGPGVRHARMSFRAGHSAAAGSHEDLPQPPTGTLRRRASHRDSLRPRLNRFKPIQILGFFFDWLSTESIWI